MAPSAPAALACFVMAMASSVLFEPVPAITLIRPAACWQTMSITRLCSSCDSVGLSPVVPTGHRPCVPSATCQSTSFFSAASSTRPLRNGVTMATVSPANCSPLRGMVVTHFLCNSSYVAFTLRVKKCRMSAETPTR
jgi:hypothetical protein